MNKAEIKLRKLVYLVSAYYLGNKLTREQNVKVDVKLRPLCEILGLNYYKLKWGIKDELTQNIPHISVVVEDISEEKQAQVKKYDFDRMLARANKFMEKLK